MIYILTGAIIIFLAFRQKHHLSRALRILGFAYFAFAVSGAVRSEIDAFGAIIYLVIGAAFIVVGTEEIRMPKDEILEDDLEGGNLAH